MSSAGPAERAGQHRTGGRISARVRILHGMMSLNDHRSVQDHTVDELARIAEVAKGSVYYHFGSKDKLVREMLVHGAAELQNILEQARIDESEDEQVATGVAPAQGRFRAQLHAAFQFLGEYPSFTGLVAFALAQRQGDESHQLRTEKEAIVGLLADQLHQLEMDEADEDLPWERLTPQTTLEITATALLSAAVTLSIEQLTVHPDWNTEDCVEALLRMVTTGRSGP